MKRILLIFAALAVVALLLLIWATRVEGPAFVRRKLDIAVAKNCHGCVLEIARIETPLLSFGDVILRGVKFKSGKPGGAEVKADVEEVIASIDLRHSSAESLLIKRLRVHRPQLVYTDGDAPSPASASTGESEAGSLSIDATEIRGGQIVYIRNTHGTHAEFVLRDISLSAGTFSTVAAHADAAIDVQTTAQVENSGAIELDVKVKPFAPSLFVDVDLKVRGQNLADLTKFLKANAGVELMGQLERGRSRIRVRGDEAKVRVWAEYHGLNVKLHPMYDRSEWMAFLTSLGTDLTMSEDNEDSLEIDKRRSIVYTRKPGQSIVGFIVQGMKAAAIKVAQAN